MAGGWRAVRCRHPEGSGRQILRAGGGGTRRLAAAFGALRAAAALALAVTGAAGLAAAVLWRPATRRVWAGIAVAVLLGAVCGAVATAARLAGRDAPQVAAAGPGSGHRHSGDQSAPRPGSPAPRCRRAAVWLIASWLVRLQVDDEPPVRTRVRVLVFATDPAWQELRPGDRVPRHRPLGPAPRGGPDRGGPFGHQRAAAGRAATVAVAGGRVAAGRAAGRVRAAWPAKSPAWCRRWRWETSARSTPASATTSSPPA